ncbi:MAG: zinc ABC transporter substrate-binding protein [Arcobacteraceae bacterium]
MKKLILSLALGATSFLYANINAVVSILPQQTFLEKIGGDKVNITLMVQPGDSPHMYEPKPSQMKDISKADIYFSLGVEFEDVWLEKLTNQNKSMIVRSMSDNITRIAMVKHSHGEEENGHDEHDHDEHQDNTHDVKKDSHIWTTPANVKIMAQNIYNILSLMDRENEAYYKKNLTAFLKEIHNTDKTIKELLSKIPTHSKFMVFHPAWGYFAKEYHLEQIAIESGGKNPKPKQIAHLIEEAKEEKVRAVFTAPEFSTKVAEQIAKEVGIPVVKMSSLDPKWSESMIKLAKNIAQ